MVYQIYPRSFQDSDGDGIGDLKGIRARLDYLHDLGADVIWLCPVYQSPNDDGGYDISDYQAILPEFGTLEDFSDLLDGLHARGMKLIMDLVVNHTSDEHPWFLESRKGRTLPDGTLNPYRDYYIWRPASEDGQEPNNWGSHFGGSAWKLDPERGEYFLHLFSPRQPDLNWEHPEVRQEIYRMMRWWLDQGVDGFRMDTINMLSKVPDFPDAPQKQDERYPLAELHFLNGPRLLEYLREMRREVLDHYDVLTVGEAPGVSPELGAQYTHETEGVLSMIFQFEQMALDKDLAHPTPRWTQVPWSLAALKEVTGRWQHVLHGQGWNSVYLSNHDVPRMVSRFGDDGEYRVQSAKLLATFLHTLQGTPYIYQGDEIGTTNVQFRSISEYRDVDTLNLWREEVTEGGGDPQATLERIWAQGRDNARTPMQWDATPGAGFTTGTPWIGVNPNHTTVNVQAALADPDSVYWYTRELIRLRQDLPVIVDGRYDLLLPDHPQLYAYTRTTDTEQLLVLLNFSREPVTLDWPAASPPACYRLLLSNLAATQRPELHLTLAPFEARVYHALSSQEVPQA
ncbi:alpha-glucosidase [Deinococcus aquiradiocola]|uniref:Alpha-glucosidase n=1 Tax=Deinococcus aquiradiocola TaxID=393059 RepID=A0A917PHG4_9DEIO|nr:alpha-glucosidase [Deinococcus aquiradiocola]